MTPWPFGDSDTLWLYLPVRVGAGALWHTQHRRHASWLWDGMRGRHNRLHHFHSSTIMVSRPHGPLIRPLKFHIEFSILQDCCIPLDHNLCELLPLRSLHPWQPISWRHSRPSYVVPPAIGPTHHSMTCLCAVRRWSRRVIQSPLDHVRDALTKFVVDSASSEFSSFLPFKIYWGGRQCIFHLFPCSMPFEQIFVVFYYICF